MVRETNFNRTGLSRTVFGIVIALFAYPAVTQDFRFDFPISRAVLKNYLDRSISFTEILHDDLAKPRNNRGMESVPVPEHVFTAFGRPAAVRNFRYQDMVYVDGRQVNHWGTDASVPDMTRMKTKTGFFFLAAGYVDTGIEALHFGQFGLMDWNVRKFGNTPFIRGWDEITWWALMPEAERNDWLRSAWKWVEDTDPEGHR